jgi:hypothetical protein
MIKIYINGAEAGYLVHEDWDMWLSESSWSRYTFEFKNPKDATLFSLAWAQYA